MYLISLALVGAGVAVAETFDEDELAGFDPADTEDGEAMLSEETDDDMFSLDSSEDAG